MWPFTSRGARARTVGMYAQLLGSTVDYSRFAKNDAWIKLWLPERLDNAIDELSATHDASKPDVLRWLLFEHVYGRQEFEVLIKWQRKESEKRRHEALKPKEDISDGVQFSPQRGITIKVLGKSTLDLKVSLPAQLKDDLEPLARSERMGLSDYVRKVLVRVLLGERLHQQWQQAIGNIPADVIKEEAVP